MHFRASVSQNFPLGCSVTLWPVTFRVCFSDLEINKVRRKQTDLVLNPGTYEQSISRKSMAIGQEDARDESAECLGPSGSRCVDWGSARARNVRRNAGPWERALPSKLGLLFTFFFFCFCLLKKAAIKLTWNHFSHVYILTLAHSLSC